MTMRITGMNSGLDTESIITELLKAKSTKKDTLTKAQKKLEYKQEAWNTLNSKIYALYSKTINDLSYTSTYKKQTTKVSNSSAASVITGKDASNGVQELKISSLAKSGYLTGAQLSENGKYTASTKLSDIEGSGIGAADEVALAITTGGKTTDIKLRGTSTISDVVTQLKNAGVNANFDEKNQRLFISSKTTGEDADFALTASTENGFKALSALGINVMDTQTKAQYEMYAGLNETENADAKQKIIDDEVAKQAKNLKTQIETYDKAIETHQKNMDNFLTAKGYKNEDGTVNTEKLEQDYADLKAKKEQLSTPVDGEDEEQRQAREAELRTVEADILAIESYKTEEANMKLVEGDKAAAEAKLANNNAALITSVTADLETKIAYANQVVSSGFDGVSKGATRVEGKDAEITLNDAVFTSSSNTFEINGLTITALNETKEDEVVTLTTADDYEAIYDTIKNFITEYNTLINEMDKLYNAESSKGYEPLTDEEKSELSESEVEKWETKIKDSILRRDSTLNEITSIFKTTMMKGFEVNGKTMYLSSFGINTLGYFNAAANERGAYHIDGDPDDASTKGNSDVLKSMIANDPETVISFFTQLSKELYSELGEKMKSSDYSSFNKVYNDKQMKDEYDDYKEKIARQEEIITAAEDKYYKQFSAMETALAKLQSKENAIAGLLGG